MGEKTTSKLTKDQKFGHRGKSEKDRMCIGSLSDGFGPSCMHILHQEMLSENIILWQIGYT